MGQLDRHKMKGMTGKQARHVFIGLGVLLAVLAQVSGGASSQSAPADPVFVGAGDIASCNSNGDEATARLLDRILGQTDGTVFTAGDNLNSTGSLDEFKACYGPTWGRFKARTRPVPGNHEYVTPHAAGYFDYFGKRAGPRGLGFYSYNLGAWHIIALNSSIGSPPGSPQDRWLRADLEANKTTMCTLAYWHHPVFGSYDQDKESAGLMRDVWKILYEYGVDVVVNGHFHYYERFVPLDADGHADPQRGIREFIVGTGGAVLSKSLGAQPLPGSEVRDNSTWGVLKFTLHPTSYDWEFIPAAGGTFHDSGSAPCVAPPDSAVF
jgi:hypothetical protein